MCKISWQQTAVWIRKKKCTSYLDYKIWKIYCNLWINFKNRFSQLVCYALNRLLFKSQSRADLDGSLSLISIPESSYHHITTWTQTKVAYDKYIYNVSLIEVRNFLLHCVSILLKFYLPPTSTHTQITMQCYRQIVW